MVPRAVLAEISFMTLFSTLRQWARLGGDLLWPPRCVFCGAEPGDGELRRRVEVCDGCARAITAGGPRCGGCGQPGDANPCGRCGGRLGRCAGIVVLGGYADALRDAVLRAKRPTGDMLTAGLAALIVEQHRDRLEGWGIDLVVPVPMHWRRRAARGTSAADELARGVAAGLGLPRRRVLRRSRPTVMQNELPREERRGNVAGAFRAGGWLGGWPGGGIADRRILLVDDVTTTGATLAACSDALLSAGAASVYAAVAARADATDTTHT